MAIPTITGMQKFAILKPTERFLALIALFTLYHANSYIHDYIKVMKLFISWFPILEIYFIEH